MKEFAEEKVDKSNRVGRLITYRRPFESDFGCW